MADMDRKEIESAVEAILFASGEPVRMDRICTALGIDRPAAEQVLQKLMDYYAYERRGIRLLKIEDSWQLCSAPDYADVIRRAFEIRKPAKLSQPALEVLTIVAYYQPTTRAYVDQIRGVDSSYTMGLLLERGIVATQATISRDIKQLHLVKAPAGQGKYRYAVSDHGSKIHVADKLQTIFRESIVNVDYAQNLVVIHTMSGLANGAAAALDGMEIDQLIGTLAGDDTVLIIMRDNESAAELATSIRTMLH